MRWEQDVAGSSPVTPTNFYDMMAVMNFQELYNNLMILVDQPEAAFYYVDQEHNGHLYRIFSYRLASYADFCQPSAREARGCMFEIDQGGTALRIASQTPSKFFNYKENPFVMELDFSSLESITDKMDGSLISTYLEDGKVYTKSKTSLYSDQAVAAQKYLDRNQQLYDFCLKIENMNGTVNMEYTAPTNRIVLYYPQESLKIFGVRINGITLSHNSIKDLMKDKITDIEKYLVPNILDTLSNPKEFIDSIPEMTGIEGYVVNIHESERVKIKTNWYVSLHQSKDSVNSDKRLFECVVNEFHDDLKAMFSDDLWLMDRVEKMEKKVKEILAELHMNTFNFYNENRLLDRKSYAILGQQALDQKYFGLAMMLYSGKELNIKEWLVKHYKEFDISEKLIEE